MDDDPAENETASVVLSEESDVTDGHRVAASGESDEVEAIEDPRVVAAVERLADLEGLPVAEQVEIFADIHARLAEALGTEAGGDPSTASE